MPQGLIQHTPIIGIWEIVNPWQDLLALFQYPSLFADDVRSIASDNRKCEWLAVRLLITNLTGIEMRVRNKENGAPYLENGIYNISISHTKGFAAVLLSKHPRPGIDIEYRSDRAWKVKTKFLNAKELELVETANEHAGSRPFTQQATISTLCWCAKESVYKALQETDVDFIHHLHIAPFELSDNGYFLLNETKTKKKETYHIHYQQTDSYLLTWIAGIYSDI